MTTFAYYRLPYSDTYTAIESEHAPLILPSYESIGGMSGFIIAPFAAGDDCPIALIRPDRVSSHAVSINPAEYEADDVHADDTADVPSEAYSSAFDAFHGAVRSRKFRKLVLARRKTISLGREITAEAAKEYFLKACQMYPRLMVMLFSTPETGTWIVSSPEILIEGHGDTYHTVALAGTMPYREGYLDWSEKNKAEQHIVEQYIAETLSPLCNDMLKDGPVTTRAANLVHLRTDFRFHLKHGSQLGVLIGKLHPTPAVCGLPKHDARDFINANEHLCRRYYSGFAGPIGINEETHLYVSLRCAEFSHAEAFLYAGGGIMPDSVCSSEWQETESKMKTIAHVLQ